MTISSRQYPVSSFNIFLLTNLFVSGQQSIEYMRKRGIFDGQLLRIQAIKRDILLGNGANVRNDHRAKNQKITQVYEEAWDNVQSGSILDYSLDIYDEAHPFEDRNLQQNGIKFRKTSPIRIFFDTSSFSKIPSTLENQIRLEVLENQIIPEMKRIWSEALSVIPVKSPIYLAQDICYGSVEVSDVYYSDGISDSDLVIFAHAENCEGDGTLAYAFPCSLDRVYDRPVVGFISFCLEFIELDENMKVKRDQLRKFTEVAVHELGHVLGMSSNLFPFYRHPESGTPLTSRPLLSEPVTCVDGLQRRVILPSTKTLQSRLTSKDVMYYEVVTPTVKQVTQNQFGCDSLNGARLENQPTNKYDCFGSHWDERLFFTEAMGPIYSSSTNILSPLTLALLEDSGWYISNYKSVSISPFGHGAGCNFVNKDCIVNGQVPEYGKGSFCNQVARVTEHNGKLTAEGTWMCDPSHTHLAVCDLFDGFFDPPPKKFQYFSNNNLSPALYRADFCPIPHLSQISCTDTSQRPVIPGEVFGPRSKCFNANAERQTAICLPSFCNEKDHVVEVFINGKKIICYHEGQIHTLSDGKSTFECPKLALICPDLICPSNCSGKGVCDYSLKDPKCICFDPEDTSSGCYGTPSQTSAPTSSSTAIPNPSTETTAPTPLPTTYSSVIPSNATSPSSTPSSDAFYLGDTFGLEYGMVLNMCLLLVAVILMK